ncbi:MAG: Methylated-DNA--protein-cysteine methyltransferase [Candidatus Hydrogenedentes bacterium ADurb.Bin101]|nr:MAG: Methylated-DNA--protein-cysteine methyltransferase [Candidatus Hydrogenedentes bacterium ADurb.Bin101]
MILSVANFRFPIPGGVLYGYMSERGLRALQLYADNQSPPPWAPLAPHLDRGRELWHLLECYFAGLKTDFDAVVLDLENGTAFQRRVWREACVVPYGSTTSYGALAQAGGAPRAARAVGTALGANPVILLVPCHRVIAADGSLGGYGPGLLWKRFFLALEQGVPPRQAWHAARNAESG